MLSANAPQLLLNRGDHGISFAGRCPFGRDPQLHFALAGIGGHGGVAELQQRGHRLGQAGFRNAPEMQQPAAECAADQVLRLEPRHGGLLPHGPHFAGHAGEGQHGEARLRRPDDSGSCTGGVGQYFSPLRQECLFAVADPQTAAARAQFGFQVGQHLRALFQRNTKAGRQGFGGEVVGRGAQTTGANQQPAAASCLQDGLAQALGVIAHHALAEVGNA